MITTITGRLVEKSPTELVVECNGLGYLINISLNTFSKLGNDENIRLYTYLQVKEDSHTLFGFFDKKGRLIAVKKITNRCKTEEIAILLFTKKLPFFVWF